MRFISSLAMLALLVTTPHSLALASETLNESETLDVTAVETDDGITDDSEPEADSQTAAQSAPGNKATQEPTEQKTEVSEPSQPEPSQDSATNTSDSAAEADKDPSESQPDSDSDDASHTSSQAPVKEKASAEDTLQDDTTEPAPHNGVTVTNDGGNRVIEVDCDVLTGDHEVTFTDIDSLTVSWSESCDAPEAAPTEGFTLSDSNPRTAEVSLGTTVLFTATRGTLTVTFDETTHAHPSPQGDQQRELPTSNTPESDKSELTASEGSSDPSQTDSTGGDSHGITVTSDGPERVLQVTCDAIAGIHEYVVTVADTRTLSLTWDVSCTDTNVTPHNGLTPSGDANSSGDMIPGATVTFFGHPGETNHVTILFDDSTSGDGSLEDSFDDVFSAPFAPRSLMMRSFSTVYVHPYHPPGVTRVSNDGWRDTQIDCRQITETATFYTTATSQGAWWDVTNLGDCDHTIISAATLSDSRFTANSGAVVSLTRKSNGETLTIKWGSPQGPSLSPASRNITIFVDSEMTPTAAMNATGFSSSPTYTIAPTLPAGLSINASNGVISGTPTATMSASNYVITATAGGQSATATLSITVSGPAISPASQIRTTVVNTMMSSSSALTANGFSTTPTYSISPDLPAGLSFNTSTGVISGTPTTTLSARQFDITATAGSQSATATFTLTVSGPTLTPASATVAGFVNTAITSTAVLTPTGFASAPIYTVSPALPEGLSLNSSSGVISGTPTVDVSNQQYVITGTAGGLSATAFVTITINPPPTELLPGLVQIQGAPNFVLELDCNVQTGNPVINIPHYPGGTLVINTKGTCTTWVVARFDTGITGGGGANPAFSASFNVIPNTRIDRGQSPHFVRFNYYLATRSAEPLGLRPATQTRTTAIGLGIGQTDPITADGFSSTPAFSISPDLPAGLSLDSATGVVSGTPTEFHPQTTHTITASGGGLEATASVTISVNSFRVLFHSNALSSPFASAIPAPIFATDVGDSIVLPAGPTRSNHAFNGWFTSQTDPTTKVGNPGDTYVPTASVVLFAQWTGPYVVTYNRQGGSGTPASTSVAPGNSFNLPNQNNWGALTFAGWFDAPSGGTRVGGSGTSFTPTGNVTLYAQWNATLSFMIGSQANTILDPPGSTNRVININTDTTQITLPNVSRPGSVFNGWWSSANGGIKRGDAGHVLTLTGNLTLHAQWLAVYRIDFDPIWSGERFDDDRCQPVGPLGNFCRIEWVQGEPDITLPTPSLPGYIFQGWFTHSSGGTKRGDGGAVLANSSSFQNQTFRAQWAPQVGITFDPRQGVVVDHGNQCEAVGLACRILVGVGQNQLTLPQATRLGWELRGWFSHPSAGTLLGQAGSVLNNPSSGNAYARWFGTATLSGEGGQVAVETVTADEGETITQPIPYRPGFAFRSWMAGDQMVVYRGTRDFAFDNPGQWTAVWEQNSAAPVVESVGLSENRQVVTLEFSAPIQDRYTGAYLCSDDVSLTNAPPAFQDQSNLTCVISGSTLEIRSPQAPDTQSLTSLALPALGRSLETSIFSAEPTSMVSAAEPFAVAYVGRSLASAGDFELLVHQTDHMRVDPPRFTITFDRSGGGSPSTVTVSEGSPVVFPTAPSRTGFVFTGWFTSPSGGARVDGPSPFVPSASITLYAQWRPAPPAQATSFTVVFDRTGGGPATRIEVTQGSAVTFPRPPSRIGFTFAGWFTSQTGGTRVDGGRPFVPTASLTLYAQWTAVPQSPSVIPVVAAPPSPSAPASSRPPAPRPESPLAELLPEIPLRPQPAAPTPVTPPAPPAPPVQRAPATPPPPAPVAPPRGADSGSVLQRTLEKPSGTVDLGGGVQSLGESGQESSGSLLRTVEVPVRTPGEKRAEVLQGFAPSSTTDIEVVGARTGARFTLSPQVAGNRDRVAEAMASSAASSSTDFFEVRAVQPVTEPEPLPSWDESERNTVSSLFESSGLVSPKSLNDFDVSGFTEWVKIESEAKTYVPGSTVYLTVTSEPIVIGQARVNASGDAELVGTIPVELLSPGEHRIRLIGIRLLDGVSVDEDGNVQVTDDVMAEIQRFDQGTQVTVAVLGQNPEGEQHTSLRIVALPEDVRVAWWPLWLIVGAFGLFVVARTRGLLGQPMRRSIGLGVVGVSALPAIVMGVASGVLALTWWGLAAGLLAVGLAFFVPERDPEAETA